MQFNQIYCNVAHIVTCVVSVCVQYNIAQRYIQRRRSQFFERLNDKNIGKKLEMLKLETGK